MSMSRRSTVLVAMTVIMMGGALTFVGAFTSTAELIFAGPAMVAGALTWLENGRTRS